MKYLFKYDKFNEASTNKQVIKLLDKELDIYEKYFLSNGTKESITNKYLADEEEDGWVAMFSYNIHTIYGMFQSTYSNKTYEHNLFINLNVIEGLFGQFIKNELKRKKNLNTLLHKSNTERGFNIQIVFEIINSNLDIIHSDENIYNNGNLYVNMLAHIKFKKQFYDVLPAFFEYASDDMIIELWNNISQHKGIFNCIKKLSKQYKNIWNRINSLIKLSNDSINIAKNLSNYGFDD